MNIGTVSRSTAYIQQLDHSLSNRDKSDNIIILSRSTACRHNKLDHSLSNRDKSDEHYLCIDWLH